MNSIRITTNSRSIWNFLKSQGLSEYGIAGLMGNLYAESGLSPINLENIGNTRLGITDAEYTEAVDSGNYDNFIYDGFGYGLAQWTWHSRKQELYNFCKTLGLSIGDLNGQLKYLMIELKSSSYSSLLKILKNASSIKEASDAVLTQFERPADMSDNVKNLRASYGQEYYDYFCSKSESEDTIANITICNINGGKEKYIKYTIVPGDTLWDISTKFGSTLLDIVNANEEIVATIVSTIYPGQIVYIPLEKATKIKKSIIANYEDNTKKEEIKNTTTSTANTNKNYKNTTKVNIPTKKKITSPFLERVDKIKRLLLKK